MITIPPIPTSCPLCGSDLVEINAGSDFTTFSCAKSLKISGICNPSDIGWHSISHYMHHVNDDTQYWKYCYCHIFEKYQFWQTFYETYISTEILECTKDQKCTYYSKNVTELILGSDEEIDNFLLL